MNFVVKLFMNVEVLGIYNVYFAVYPYNSNANPQAVRSEKK